jgi:HEAT repeat protein
MAKRAKIAGIALGALVLALVAIAAMHGREPRYRGRSLTSWLEQCSDTPLMETQRLAQAQDAVRAIGAQKALPTLLSLVRTRDNPIRAWLAGRTFKRNLRHNPSKFHTRWFDCSSAIECQLEGIAGFEVLGTNCGAAVGELSRLLDDKELAFVAVRCLDSIGKPAEQALCQCLTNADPQVREWSVTVLASATDDVEVYVGRIKPALYDAESSVRLAAVKAIGAQSKAPELALPVLISMLNDADDSVSSGAAGGLAGFGTNALSGYSALTNLAITGREGQIRAALNALAAIDAFRALPILSNAVINGSPAIMGTALGKLKPIAPDLALKMTLAELHSTDARRMNVALNQAWTYEVDTPGISEALKSAAKVAESEVARMAVNTMRELLRKQRDKTGSAVRMPHEPEIQGKPLGEWLAMRSPGWELATNAVEALRQMGTNVIPALLARLTYKDPVFNLDDYDVSMEAATALIYLRDQANPALPTLGMLIDSEDQDLALRAMIAAMGTGADAIPCLMKGLTNQSALVRGEAAHFLTEWGAQFPEERKKAIPYVARLLDDTDEQIRRSVTNELKELDPQAAAKAGVK